MRSFFVRGLGLSMVGLLTSTLVGNYQLTSAIDSDDEEMDCEEDVEGVEDRIVAMEDIYEAGREFFLSSHKSECVPLLNKAAKCSIDSSKEIFKQVEGLGLFKDKKYQYIFDFLLDNCEHVKMTSLERSFLRIALAYSIAKSAFEEGNATERELRHLEMIFKKSLVDYRSKNDDLIKKLDVVINNWKRELVAEKEGGMRMEDVTDQLVEKWEQILRKEQDDEVDEYGTEIENVSSIIASDYCLKRIYYFQSDLKTANNRISAYLEKGGIPFSEYLNEENLVDYFQNLCSEGGEVEHYCKRLVTGLPGSGHVKSIAEVSEAIKRFNRSGAKKLVKEEFNKAAEAFYNEGDDEFNVALEYFENNNSSMKKLNDVLVKMFSKFYKVEKVYYRTLFRLYDHFLNKRSQALSRLYENIRGQAWGKHHPKQMKYYKTCIDDLEKSRNEIYENDLSPCGMWNLGKFIKDADNLLEAIKEEIGSKNDYLWATVSRDINYFNVSNH